MNTDNFSVTGSYRLALPVLLVLVLSACTQSLTMETKTEVPTPLVTKLPLNMGVYYDEKFRNYTYEENSEDRPNWSIKSGASQVDLFDQVLPSMFEQTSQVESIASPAKAGLDGLLAPEILEMQFALPQETRSDLYEVWIKYQIKLHDARGKLIADWAVTGYGKSSTEFLKSRDKGLHSAINSAFRDAGAKFAINFTRVPEIRQWLQKKPGFCARGIDGYMLNWHQRIDGLARLLPVLAVFLLLSSCKSTTRIDEYRQAPTGNIISGDTVVVLGRRHSSGHETEIDFISCVGDTLASNKDAISVVPEKEFVDAMYPYFETSTAPMDIKNLDRLVQNPTVAAKLAEYRIRFFIWIDGSTETTDKKGSISCAVGPGGGGCFGFATWDDEANYEASIWDFKNLQLAGKINAETQGTSYLPAIIVPIPMLARVQSGACKSMAQQIKSFLQ